MVLLRNDAVMDDAQLMTIWQQSRRINRPTPLANSLDALTGQLKKRLYGPWVLPAFPLATVVCKSTWGRRAALSAYRA